MDTPLEMDPLGVEPVVETADTVDNLNNVANNQIKEDANYDVDLGKLTGFLGRCVVNLVLPFVNGLMLGFGEIVAHEVCAQYGWRGARGLIRRKEKGPGEMTGQRSERGQLNRINNGVLHRGL
ncbi:uncharacterized protein C5L36_0B08330 [Pichia kudriavzevii]|uniref:Mitochondrial import protein 1 n=1 Tax=Pichia kudriavzevii TaxID=4909 RepID=A0A099P128_PICKU|nr:uncharacterized protein C5L36_0B08330 [Pichia kudriavzevii]AWU75587.1 hypothetical protein C5L36_0B08330 [Pichia kudriavzevii]KGK38605.1 hypothetical protein JL09_g2296 [Pichia kudriavzevii]